MKFPTTLLGWLAKANPGNSRPEARDGVVEINPVMLNAGRFPFPITRTTGPTSLLLAPEKVAGSIIFHRLDGMASTIGLNILEFPEGVWDVHLNHKCVQQGSVQDLTSQATLLLQVIDAGVTRFAILNRLLNSHTLTQEYHQDFTLTVTKEIPTNIRIEILAGAATGFSQSLISVIANRIY